MGAWSFVRNRFQDILNCNVIEILLSVLLILILRLQLRYVGRPPLSTPAVGITRPKKSLSTSPRLRSSGLAKPE